MPKIAKEVKEAQIIEEAREIVEEVRVFCHHINRNSKK